MRCTSCRKAEVLDTWWDKIRVFFFRQFKRDLEDFRMDFYTQGISEGYKLGFNQATSLKYEDSEKLAIEASSLRGDGAGCAVDITGQVREDGSVVSWERTNI